MKSISIAEEPGAERRMGRVGRKEGKAKEEGEKKEGLWQKLMRELTCCEFCIPR